MTWNPIELPTDKLKLAGRISPGICEVSGASSPRRWDELAGYAMSGAILIYRGIKLSHFTVRFSLYTLEDWADWAAFRPLVMRPPIGTAAKTTYDIVHPVLNEVDIHHCVIEDVQAPVQTEDGVWTVELSCIESRVIKQSISKPDAAEATPEDPKQKELDALNAQRDKLAADRGNP